MAKKSEQLTLDELRDKSVKSQTKLSFGKEMGGYNKKQVTEYIENLSANLSSAEESFNQFPFGLSARHCVFAKTISDCPMESSAREKAVSIQR